MDDKQLGGICIGTRPWRENDRMLSLFCDDGCVYDVLARGACKPKYKLKFAAQLFSVCDYHLCPSKAGYYILGGAAFTELSFLSLSSDPSAYAAACVVCEAAGKCVLGENKRMYAETMAALGELSGGGRGDLTVLRILLAAFVSGGFGAALPQGENGAVCRGVLDAAAGDVSSLPYPREHVSALIKSFGARFCSQFGKLNSLAFFGEV